MTNLNLTTQQLAKIHEALCLLGEKKRNEAAANRQIDAMFPGRKEDLEATYDLRELIFMAHEAASSASRGA